MVERLRSIHPIKANLAFGFLICWGFGSDDEFGWRVGLIVLAFYLVGIMLGYAFAKIKN